jgi:hypothetical protein
MFETAVEDADEAIGEGTKRLAMDAPATPSSRGPA